MTLPFDPTLPDTEQRSPRSTTIDTVSTLAMLRMINAEDRRVAGVVAGQIPAIAEAVDRIAGRMREGGRLIYIGAGTSGRLGALDASECPPTFNTAPGQVLGLIAGGPEAFWQAVEGAEDDEDAGRRDLELLDLAARDCVVGLAASGRTPYVLGALREARRRGALTVSVACARPAPMEALADMPVALVVGPEVLTGSTRLKAGTAQKMVLNMLSTAVMIRLDKTYSNWMVDLRASNEKLHRRARRIVAEACQISLDEAAGLLEQCGGEVKTALVAHLASVDPTTARALLSAAGGTVRAALQAAVRP